MTAEKLAELEREFYELQHGVAEVACVEGTDWEGIEKRVKELVGRGKELESFIIDHFEELTTWNFPLYAGLNLRIPTKYGKEVPFIFNRLQRYLWRLLLEDLEGGRPVRWYILKGRQIGCSTWILSLFYWLCSYQRNRGALVVAHDEASTHKFCAKMRHNLHLNSHVLLKQETAMENRTMLHFGDDRGKRNAGTGIGINSVISFETANKSSLGVSYTLQYVHLSEYALWEKFGIDPEEVLPGLLQAVPKMAGTMIIKETTARGGGKAKDDWDNKNNGYRKIFISWLADESYRTPLADGEILSLSGSEEMGGQQTHYGNEVEEARLIRAELKVWYPESAGSEEWLDREVLARLKWRRGMIDGECLGKKDTFRYEYPTCPMHAWMSHSSNCFDELALQAMREYVEEKDYIAPIECDYIHNPDVTDMQRKFKQAPYGKVLFYKLPERGGTYVIGADTSMGLSPQSDPSAALVLRVTPDSLEEVCGFNSIIPPDEFAELLYYLGRLYNDALLAVERKEGAGAAINVALSKYLYYPRLYYHHDPLTHKRDKTPGFLTNANKSILVSDLAQLIRDHQIIFRSEGLWDQLSHFQERDDGKLKGAPGCKDDFVSAALIAAFLTTKVHSFQQPKYVIAKGSVDEAAEQIRRKMRGGRQHYRMRR